MRVAFTKRLRNFILKQDHFLKELEVLKNNLRHFYLLAKLSFQHELSRSRLLSS